MSLFSKKNLDVVNKYGITEKDMICQLKCFPVGVVVRMMEEQELQGNKPDVTIFQKNKIAGESHRGFSWMTSRAGYNFWASVISNRNFNLFFDKYPEYKQYNC